MTKLKIKSDGTALGTKLFFVVDEKEIQMKNCEEIKFSLSVYGDRQARAQLTFFNVELDLDSNIKLLLKDGEVESEKIEMMLGIKKWKEKQIEENNTTL